MNREIPNPIESARQLELQDYESAVSAERAAQRFLRPEAALEAGLESDSAQNAAERLPNQQPDKRSLSAEQVAQARIQQEQEREAEINNVRSELTALYTEEDKVAERYEQERNPNSIGTLIPAQKGISTTGDKVYRSISHAAIQDLFDSGVVRNAYTAGKGQKKRWGDKVFWSRGEVGKKHTASVDNYVIEAPFDVANERQVTLGDVSAIYETDAGGNIRNTLARDSTEEAQDE